MIKQSFYLKHQLLLLMNGIYSRQPVRRVPCFYKNEVIDTLSERFFTSFELVNRFTYTNDLQNYKLLVHSYEPCVLKWASKHVTLFVSNLHKLFTQINDGTYYNIVIFRIKQRSMFMKLLLFCKLYSLLKSVKEILQKLSQLVAISEILGTIIIRV